MNPSAEEGNTPELVRLAGEFGLGAITQYRAENPSGYAAFEKLLKAGGAKFDVTVRDVTGFAPTVELVVVTGEHETVLASQVLKRRD
jgi:hypothetical protein